MLNLSKIKYNSLFGKLIRQPLKLIPSQTILPVLQGELKGYKWIKGSSINGCWLGDYEYDKQLLFVKKITTGMTFYDVGANVGFYSLLASKLTGNFGMVYSFEPLPENINYLKRHLKINSLENVQVLNKAVSDKVEKLYFKKGINNSTGHLSADGETLIDTITLDEFVLSGNKPPNLIKFDIEGAEYNALCGAAGILKKYKPTIFLATHGENIKEKCITFLSNLKYKIHPISAQRIEDSEELLAEY